MDNLDAMSSVSANMQSPPPPRSKRSRLALACTQCRKRKVRCDATTPKCRNCVLRGDPCETFDPRHPKGPAVRRWPTKDGSPGQNGQVQRHGSVSEQSTASSLMSTRPEPPAPLLHSASSRNHPSWVERAYQENQARQDDCMEEQTNESPDVVMNTDDTSHRVKVRAS